eukprot:3911793-Ditylum_brightwellii.AAC.1
MSGVWRRILHIENKSKKGAITLLQILDSWPERDFNEKNIRVLKIQNKKQNGTQLKLHKT